MAITDTLNLTPEQVAEQNPELDRLRQIAFGEDYLSDIAQGTGTAQYYTGFGDPNAIDYTEAPIEESIVDTSTPVIDTGGGGGGGAGTITPDAGGNTAFEQNLLDQGIGVQAEPGAPISAPGEEMLLQQDIDDLAAYPLSSQSFAEGKATLEDAGGVPELGGVYATDYFPENNFLSDLDREALDTDLESMGGTYEPPIEQLNEPQEDIYQDQIMNIASQPMSQEELISSSADQGLEAFDPTLRDQIGNAFSSVKDKGVGGINILKDQLTALGGKVKEGFDNTIEIGGQTIDLGKSLLGGAISLVSGIPVVGTALSLAGDAFETSPEQKAMQSAALAAGIADPNDPRKDIYGINIVSAFGDYDQSVDDSIATLEESGANPEKLNKLKNYQNEKSKIDTATITTRDDAIDVGIAASDTDPADRGIQAANVDFSQERTDQNISQAIDDLAAQYDRSGKVDETITSDVSKAKSVIGMPQNLGDVGQGDPTGSRSQATADNQSGYGGSCFIAGTKVRMADGTDKNIEDVIVGDKVKGQNGNNEVTALDPTLLADRKLYSFNDNEHYFFTSEHPFMTEEGWKSIKPEKTKERDGVELYDQLKGELKVGDKLVTDSGVTNITEIKSKEMNDPKMPLYNFHISNDNSYIADDYVVHNKGCFIKGTLITMADGSTKPVEQVDLGDKVAKGGKVFAAGRFLVNNLYDYKGIKVSGSHMVNEDNTWVRVRDSEKGKPLGDDKHTVYVFGAENRRILINGILFTDYFEIKEQDQLATIGNKYFDQWGVYAKNDDINNVNTLNAS